MQAATAMADVQSGFTAAFSGRRLGILTRETSITSFQFILNTSLNYRKLSGGRVLQKPVSVSKSRSELQGFHGPDSNRYSEVRSCLLVVGLDFQSAPLGVLEKLAISYSELPQAVGELSSLFYVEEAAILSIFDRIEIYVFAHADRIGSQEITSWMAKKSGVDLYDVDKYYYMYSGNKAARHLFEVTAGFHSLVPQRQILAQVEEVAKHLKGINRFGRVMNALFEHAICFGKLRSSQISLADGSLSAASAAVDLAWMLVPTSGSRTKVLIIGEGMMGITVIKHLVAKGFKTITVIDRTESKFSVGQDEAKGVKIIYKPLKEMVSCIREAEAVFTCMASESPLILEEHIRKLYSITSEPEGLKYFFDIAIPRNVDEGVFQLPFVLGFNMKDIGNWVAQNEDRQQKTMRALDIEKHIFKFQSWVKSLANPETLKLLSCLEKTRVSVLEKHLSTLDDDDVPKYAKRAMMDLSMDLRDRFFCGTIEMLLRHSGEEYLAKAIDHIFGIPDEECLNDG